MEMSRKKEKKAMRDYLNIPYETDGKTGERDTKLEYIGNQNKASQKTECDAMKFIKGVRQLALDCNLHSISMAHNDSVILAYNFEDGSQVGARRMWNETGLFNFECGE